MDKQLTENERPPIPSNMQREVRQNCHFCCVLCDQLICDIDHIEPWSEVKCHDSNNLVLLCTTHHRMKTNGLIGKRQIREALLERKSNKPDWVKGSKIYGVPHKIFIGNNLVLPPTGTTFPVVINGVLFFKVDHYYSGRFVISLIAKDSNGNIALKIIDNLILFATSSWDIENVGKSYIVREKERKILINIGIDADNETITVTGKFDIGLDKQLVISRSGIQLGRKHTLSSGCTVKGSSIGIYLSSFDNDWPGAIVGPGNISDCHFKGFPIAIKQAYSVKNSTIEESKIAFFWSFDVLKKYS